MRGIVPTPNEDEESGSLPLMSELLISISQELLTNVTSLCMDPFASHVLRALFIVLCPRIPSAADTAVSILRSKKSAKHRAGKGPMKSVFVEESGLDGDAKGKGKPVDLRPPQFDARARQFTKAMRDGLSANEIRALAADKAAAPLLVVSLSFFPLE